MGQYYHPVNMELKEHLYSHNMDCGLKMGEILWSCYSLAESVAIFLAHNERETQQPGDLFRDGVTGRWAGHPLLYIGDYAEDGDLPGWRFDVAESELYGLLGSDNSPDEDGVPREYIEVSDFVMPVIERYAGSAFHKLVTETRMRDMSTGAMTTYRSARGNLVQVKRLPDGRYTPDMRACGGNPYYRRQYEQAREQIEARSDLSFLTDDEIAVGQRRLIVNLDKLEFMDPVAFGEVPTLAGMMRGMRAAFDSFDTRETAGWSSVQALNSMLFFNGARGGGDDEGPMVGRWRGDRLVIIGEQETSRFPSIAQVEASFDNISLQARLSVPA